MPFVIFTMCMFFKFSDEEHGEWFGYLSRQGEVVLDFKGGPFKGEWQNTTSVTPYTGALILLIMICCVSLMIQFEMLCTGFFHVPRCLYMCETLLDGLLEGDRS